MFKKLKQASELADRIIREEQERTERARERERRECREQVRKSHEKRGKK